MLYFALVVLGIFAGFLGGLLGLGGGVVFVPGLVYLFGFPIHKAIGISLAVIVPTALAGALKHSAAGNYDLVVTAILALGAIVGSYLGVSAANVMPEVVLRRVFGVFLVVLGLNALFDWSGALIRPQKVEIQSSQHQS